MKVGRKKSSGQNNVKKGKVNDYEKGKKAKKKKKTGEWKTGD